MGLFDNVMNSAKKLADSAKEINLADTMKDLQKMSESALNDLKNTGTEAIKNAKEALAKKEEPNELITPQDALRIMYYLMAADGRLDEKELEKFNEIGKEVDPLFDDHKEELINECSVNIAKETDSDFYLDNLIECISTTVRHSQEIPEGDIMPKLLLWNMIALSISDEDYSIEERRILGSVVRLLDIDKSILLEMENTIQTLLALEKEEQWLRTSGRSYGEVEEHMNELADRKAAIMQGVRALMLE